MAQDTAAKIRHAALNRFSRQWFETISIAEICREAGVSNGVFYRYYPNKTALVQSLMEEFLEQYQVELERVEGRDFSSRLLAMYKVIFKAGEMHGQQVSVFREGQYRFPEYEQRLRKIYMDCCRRVFEREISELEYLWVISGIRFNSTRAMYDGKQRNAECIAEFAINGIFPEHTVPDDIYTLPKDFPKQTVVEPSDSRERFIQSGIKLIGAQGYHQIGVADIARESNLAVGTFYTYFNSKEEFFYRIVELIGKWTRAYLRSQAEEHKDRASREMFGVWHFLSFFHQYREFYSIIREAEFVAKPWVGRYYDAFEAGYMGNLPMEDPNKRRVAANFLMGLSHYVGIEALLNNRIANIPAFVGDLAQLMCTGVGHEPRIQRTLRTGTAD